jgi:hypothetical protein
MATLYPITINGSKFYTNPTKMVVKKQSQVAQVRTMAGTTFQVWPDLPDEVHFEGMSYGIRSITELRNMANSIQKEGSLKRVDLIYKFHTYKGYVMNLSVNIDADSPRQFMYSFDFVIESGSFDMSSMPIGQLPSVKAEFDYFTAQLQQATTEIASLPSDVANNFTGIIGQVFGSGGGAEHGLGLFIGRPRPSARLGIK